MIRALISAALLAFALHLCGVAPDVAIIYSLTVCAAVWFTWPLLRAGATAGLLGWSELDVPSTLTTTARPGDPRNCPEGLPCTYTIIREAHTWGFAPIRQYTRV